MIELVVCDAVATLLSFYNAAEGDSWRNETEARGRAWSAWFKCEKWLTDQGLYEEFRQRGNYLI